MLAGLIQGRTSATGQTERRPQDSLVLARGVPMPLFFFDVIDSSDPSHPTDSIGTELANREAIPDEAADLLANIARGELPDGSKRTFSVSVRDDQGRVFYKATLSYQGGWCD
jgi:hypothetical protein